jgi:hypothetical protein
VNRINHHCITQARRWFTLPLRSKPHCLRNSGHNASPKRPGVVSSSHATVASTRPLEVTLAAGGSRESCEQCKLPVCKSGSQRTSTRIALGQPTTPFARVACGECPPLCA